MQVSEKPKSSFPISLEEKKKGAFLASCSHLLHNWHIQQSNARILGPKTLNLEQLGIILPVKLLIENQAGKMSGMTPVPCAYEGKHRSANSWRLGVLHPCNETLWQLDGCREESTTMAQPFGDGRVTMAQPFGARVNTNKAQAAGLPVKEWAHADFPMEWV